MKTAKEIEAKIEELKEEISNAYDPWEEVPRLESQINVLNWVLNDESEV